jgi:acyl-CoA synthetase (AMP-forming)/AMP-acid ligase II
VRFQRLLSDGLVSSVDRRSTHRAVVAADGSATFAELYAAASGVAASLQQEGLERGDRAVIFMENSLACATALFGVLLAGGVFVNVNPQTKADTLSFILDDCGAKFLFTEGPLAPVAAAAVDVAEKSPALVCARPPIAVPHQVIDFTLWAESGKVPRPSGAIPSDLAALLYTSGTTGRPKGVMLTHKGIVFVIDSIAEYLRLGPHDRILNVLPIAFGYGLSQLLLAARLGATLLLERSFAYPADTLRRIAAEEATVLPGIPTMFATLATMFAGAGATYPSMRAITNAAAGLPPALHDPLRELFPNALIFRMYGLTECIRVCYLEPEMLARKPTSVGKAIPGTEAFVLDDIGSPSSPGGNRHPLRSRPACHAGVLECAGAYR